MNANFKKNKQKMQYFAKICEFIKIDFSFVLIFVIAIFISEVYLYFVYVAFGLLHELTHYFVAKKLGYLAKNIRLNFFGAALEGCDDFSLVDEIKIILAGPLFNFCIVVLCYLAFWFYPESYHFLYDVLIANWSLFLFNFLPVFPLDFGRVLLAILSKKYDRNLAVIKVKKLSFIFVVLLFFISLISFFYGFNFLLGFTSVNLMCLLCSTGEDTSYKRSMFVSRKLEKFESGIFERRVYLKENTPMFKLFKFIDDYHFFTFVFVDSNFKTVKIIDEIEFYKSQKIL